MFLGLIQIFLIGSGHDKDFKEKSFSLMFTSKLDMITADIIRVLEYNLFQLVVELIFKYIFLKINYNFL